MKTILISIALLICLSTEAQKRIAIYEVPQEKSIFPVALSAKTMVFVDDSSTLYQLTAKADSGSCMRLVRLGGNVITLFKGNIGTLDTSKIAYLNRADTFSRTMTFSNGTLAPLGLGKLILQLPVGLPVGAGLSIRDLAGESIIQFGNNHSEYYTGHTDDSKAGAMIRIDTRNATPIPGSSAYSVFQIQTRAAGAATTAYTVPVQIAPAPSGSLTILPNGVLNAYYGFITSGKIFAPELLKTASTSDTIVRYNSSTGEFVAAPDRFTLFDGILTTVNSLQASSLFAGSDWTDYVSISPFDGITLHGSSTVWNDIMFPFSTGIISGSASPVLVPDSAYYTFVVDTVGSPAVCKIYMQVQLPHWWKEGSTLYPHVHYKHETGVGTPKFILKYKWFNIGTSTVNNWNWVRFDATTGTADKTMQLTYPTLGISGAGKTISSMLIIQLYLRDSPTNVHAYELDFHLEMDKLGSNTNN